MRTIAAPSGSQAFTLTDCLVLIATATFVLVIPCLAATSNRERLNRMVCLNNLRQMGQGSQMYAAEDPKGRLTGNLPRTGAPSYIPGDDLNWLYGYGPSRARFIQDLNTFICPSTQNYIRTNLATLPYTSPPLIGLTDLRDNALNPSAAGHSYEVFSYWNTSTGMVHKTLQSTATYVKTKEPLLGTAPGPAMIMLIHDALDASSPAALENYPNPYAGHGADGDNMLFADGHAEWIGVKNWSYRWSVSQDVAVTGP
jgi:prepilin-type processing-associated H-X9-DG protein